MGDIKDIKDNIAILLERTKDIQDVKSTVLEINKSLKQVELNFNSEIKRIDDKLIELETSQSFLSKEYEKNKVIMNTITTKNVSLEKENKLLKSQFSELKNELEQVKATSNESAQYHRSSVNVKISGIPYQVGEDDTSEPSNPVTQDVVVKLAKATNFSLFDKSQIDVCHRVGFSKYSPIIVRFKNKVDRMRFFGQRRNLWKLNGDNSEPLRFGNDNQEVADTRKVQTYTPYIQLQDSLTKNNADLLAETRKKAKELKYTYPGYVVIGQIRAKKDEKGKFIMIRSKSDIEKIE